MTRRKRLLTGAAAAVLALGALGVGGVYLTIKQQSVAYVPSSQSVPPGADDLQAFSAKRIYFGHQSVGNNILDGLESLSRSSAGSVPTIRKVTSPTEVTDVSSGYLVHSLVGENGRPDTKMAAFDTMMRSGMAQKVDVALMKLCYVDFGRRTDPRAVFENYRGTMSALERDFPQVTFIYTTTPLTVSDAYNNSVRTQFNSLIRTELKDKPILDIAEVESRAPDGSRATGETLGFPYEALQPEYASDGAHLNAEGSQRVAQSLVATVNRVSR